MTFNPLFCLNRKKNLNCKNFTHSRKILRMGEKKNYVGGVN